MATLKHCKYTGPPHEEERRERPPPNLLCLFNEVVKMRNTPQNVAAVVSSIKLQSFNGYGTLIKRHEI